MIQTDFLIESLVLHHSYQNPECVRNMTFSSSLQSIQKYFGMRARKLKGRSNSKCCSCSSKFDHVTKTSLLLIRLKAECIIHQNVVLTSKTPGKSMSCVGQSSASGLAGTEDFSGRRLCDRWIKCCCYLSTKFALLLTKELAFYVLWSSIPHHKQRIWL